MAVYKKDKGKWRVRIWQRGRRRDWIVEGTKAEARDFEARKRVELERAGDAPEVRTAPKFSDFSTGRYKAHAMMHLRPTTWSNRRYDIATLVEHLGSLRLTELSTQRVEDYKAARHREGKMPRTINNELMALAAILRYARSLRIPTANPTIRKLPVKKGKHAEAWTAEQVAKLYEATQAKAPELLPLVVFLANTGCRKGEAIALRWQDVDLERNLVRIWPYSDDGAGFDTKSGEAREIPISDALRPWLEAPRSSDTWVFPVPRSLKSKTGTPKPRRYAHFPKNRFAEAVKAAGLTGGPHKLRHTFASHFLAKVPDLYLLAKLMGHSYARVTELYGHLLPDHLSRARGAVELLPDIGAAAFVASSRWGVAASDVAPSAGG